MSAEDGQVMNCDAVKMMGFNQLLEYLGGVWDELWDAMLFKLRAAEASIS